jgi:hypothetical protein
MYIHLCIFTLVLSRVSSELTLYIYCLGYTTGMFINSILLAL